MISNDNLKLVKSVAVSMSIALVVLIIAGAGRPARPTGPSPTRPIAGKVDVIGPVGPMMEIYWMVEAASIRSQPFKLQPSNIIEVEIGSPGGSVEHMHRIVQTMQGLKRLGYKFSCHATMACSAAFMIWMECDERTAYDKSILLWHYPYSPIETDVNYARALELAADLKGGRDGFLQSLLSHLSTWFTEKELDDAANESKFWTGKELCTKAPGFCTIIK